MIDFIALITPGVQAGTTGDDPCRGVMHDRPDFAGELAGQRNVDARQCQQTEIRCLDQQANEFLLDGINLFLFGDPIVVECAHQLLVQRCVAVGSRSVLGPTDDTDQSAGMDLDTPQPRTVESTLATRPAQWPPGLDIGGE